MYYIVIMADGRKIRTSVASNSRSKILGFLTLRLEKTNPGLIYEQFSNSPITKTIKVVRFVDRVTIVTEADGSQHIETTWEQDPKVKIYHGYSDLFRIDKVDNEEDTWELTLTSETPEPEIVLEIYHDDEPSTETGGTADDESPTE